MESITTHSFKGEKQIPKHPQFTTEFLTFHIRTHTNTLACVPQLRARVINTFYLGLFSYPRNLFPTQLLQEAMGSWLLLVFFFFFWNVIDRFNLLFTCCTRSFAFCAFAFAPRINNSLSQFFQSAFCLFFLYSVGFATAMTTDNNRQTTDLPFQNYRLSNNEPVA